METKTVYAVGALRLPRPGAPGTYVARDAAGDPLPQGEDAPMEAYYVRALRDGDLTDKAPNVTVVATPEAEARSAPMSTTIVPEGTDLSGATVQPIENKEPG